MEWVKKKIWMRWMRISIQWREANFELSGGKIIAIKRGQDDEDVLDAIDLLDWLVDMRYLIVATHLSAHLRVLPDCLKNVK